MKKAYLIFFLIQILILPVEAQWYTQHSGTTAALYDMEFINRNTGWICGTGGTIIKTTNGGTNWIQQITNVPSKPLFGIHPVNENVVYAVGWFSTILKTTNGGDNWVAIENGGPPVYGNYFSVFFYNELTGWIGENNTMGQGDVKKTTDGGKTFNSYYTFGWPYDLYFKDSLNGIGVSGAANIHKTTNGGLNWNSFQIAGSGDFNRISFINNNTGFVVGEYSHKVYKTIDFGSNWNEIAVVEDVMEALYSIRFSSDSTGWIGGNYSRLYKTTNQGINWKRENISTGYIFNIASFNDSILWTCGNGGKIFHTTNGGEPLVGIQNISTEIPESFKLNQNYPNPFNSETIIEFSIKIKSNYKLEIINSLGRIIKILLNNELKPGSYKFNFNATEIASGLYFYRLSSENIVETKKFVLIK